MAVGSYNAVGLVYFDEIFGEHRGVTPFSELAGAAVAALATITYLGLSALIQFLTTGTKSPVGSWNMYSTGALVIGGGSGRSDAFNLLNASMTASWAAGRVGCKASNVSNKLGWLAVEGATAADLVTVSSAGSC